jgi:small basic protein
VRRALGGPIMSLIGAIVAVVIAWLMSSAGSPYIWIAVFAVLDNFLIFTLGAFLPLGFTDGSTLLRLWRERNASPAA